MTTDIIQLPPDSTGKKIAARSYTEGANTVYAQAGYITNDVAGGNPAGVGNVLPENSDYGLTVRLLNDSCAPHFYDQVDGLALNTNLWTTATTTQTITQSAGFINLNATTITTLATNSQVISNKQMPRFGYFPLVLRIAASQFGGAQANAVMELGVGNAAARSAPTDGAFFRWDSTGLKAVINNGGTEQTTAIASGPATGVVAIFEINLLGRTAVFSIDGKIVATLTAASTNSALFSVDRVPIFARVYTLASAPGTAPQLKLARVTAIQSDLAWGKSWPDIVSDSQARGAYQSPITTWGQTANWTHNTAGTTRTLAAATPAEATLGGLVYYTPTYVAGNDYPFIGYQVPAGYELHINSINISGPYFLSGTAAATATTLIWAIAANSSAASLATTDGANVWGPRRLPLGATTAAASPTTATVPNPPNLQVNFTTPLVVDGGRYLHVLARAVVARTAGTSEINYVAIGINGYFE